MKPVLTALPFICLPALAQACADFGAALPEGVTLTATEAMPAAEGRPAHCRVTAAMEERTGMDGHPYAIRFELRLPETWSGRFLHQFNGGSDGQVVPALGQREELPEAGDGALARGFAVVSSDAGHDGDAWPEAGLAGPTRFGFDFEARRNYGYAAVEKLQPVALALTEAHYGRPPDHVYGMGVSNGGRHALVAASRMPDAFDGLYVGYPGFNLPRAALQHAHDAQTLLAIADSMPDAFSRDDLALVADAVARACDGLDGLEDGLIFDSGACQARFEPYALACAESSAACLLPEKVEALDLMLDGPRDGNYDPLYTDWPWDTGIASGNWRFWKLESGIPDWDGNPLGATLGAGALAQVFSTPPVRVDGNPEALLDFLLSFDLATEAGTIHATSEDFPASAVALTAPPDVDDPNLATFAEAGGKLMIFHGISDPVFSWHDTVRWFGQAVENTPEAGRTMRLYGVPGMPHGQGGVAPDSFDMLSPLVAWVEEGIAPGAITATVRADNPEAPDSLHGAARPLCPWPLIATYRGGDTMAAESFSCEAAE